jgi:hypothetical protein
MSDSTCRSLGLTLLIVLFLTGAPSTQPLLTIGGYVKVSELRITRDITEYVYQATLTNAGPALSGATAVASSISGATTIVEGALTFGPVGAGGNVQSTDTFSFRHDRTVPFDFTNIQWSVTPLSGNHPPVANAGPDQTADVGAIVALNGSGSSDLEGDAITFAWAFLSLPVGSSAALENSTTVNPSFVVDVAGTYVVQLIVHDGTSSSAPDTVIIDTENSAPVANAGPDQTALVGQTVTLNGSGSSDVDGDPLTFAWSFVQQPPGSAAALSDPAAAHPQFTVDAPGTYRLRLVVNDSAVDSSPDFVEVSTENTAPLANAGADQSVATGSVVALNGSGSTDVDGDPLTFLWSLTSVPVGSAAALGNPTSVTPTFVVDLSGVYVVQLVVNDGFEASAPDTVTISTENSAPTANAGPDQSVVAGQTVFLDGIGSSDPDGDALTFDWAFTMRPSGSTATLVDPQTLAPSFTADLPGAYIVRLIVNDGTVASAPDTVTITTNNSAPVANAGPDQLDVPILSTVTLDGSASADADGHALTYSWSLLSIPPGSAAALDDPSAIQPAFMADTAGDYVVQLVVDDGFVPSEPDTVLVRVVGALPTVTIAATDGSASETGGTGTLTVSRTGPTTTPLNVFYSIGGTATNGTDYQAISGNVVIPAGMASAAILIAPLPDGLLEGDEDVTLTISSSSTYQVGAPAAASVTIADVPPPAVVTVSATDATASENGPDSGTFTFTRTGSTAAALTVSFTVAGTATASADYEGLGASVIIASGQTSTTAVVTPLADGLVEPPESVILTLAPGAYTVGAPSSATVTILDCASAGGTLLNGSMHCGTIATAGEADSWTFTANAGERISLHIGQMVDNNDFRPWIRLTSPLGTTLGNTSGVGAAAIDGALAPTTGTYVVVVASFDSGFDGTGSYRITMAKSTGPITVSPGDQGGPLTNGGMHTGEILRGDLDVWTFTANVGDRIAINAGQIADMDDFRPWVRLYAPNGTVLASTSGIDASVVDGVLAPVSGNYLVLVASFDSGFDGIGTYRLTLAKTSGSITVSPGDQGGPLTNGGMHTGEILEGDLDVWTFNATAGDRISVNAGDIVDTDDFRPWLRLFAPNGAVLSNVTGVNATAIDGAVAPVTGTYLVLVASFDSGFDGIGTYRLTMARTPGPITVSPGDQGGPLTNGGMHTGEILRGDLDVWTFTANVGDRISIHAGQIAETDDFRPWLRLYAPNGTVLANTSGVDASVVDGVLAPVTGTYLVLVASFDSGFDGIGTYRLTLARSSGSITVSPGDQGGALASGVIQAGAILEGDLDVWTITVAAGQSLAVTVSQFLELDDFRPWLRVYAPNGNVLTNVAGVDSTSASGLIAPVSGTYLILVGSFDSGFDGVGTYSMVATTS